MRRAIVKETLSLFPSRERLEKDWKASSTTLEGVKSKRELMAGSPLQATFPKASQGIVFIKQKYESFFHKTPSTTDFNGITSIKVSFFTKESKVKKEADIIFQIYPSKFVIKQKNYPGEDISQDLTETILPSTISDAKKLLQKKFWIRINSAINTMEFNIGDLIDPDYYDQEKDKRHFEYLLDRKVSLRNTWEASEDVFQLNPSKQTTKTKLIKKAKKNVKSKILSVEENEPQYDSTLFDLQFIQIVYDLGEVDPQASVPFIGTQKIQIMEIQEIYNSILVDSPSLLTRDANRYDMGEEIQSLYNYLRDLSITDLPQTDKPDSADFNKTDYNSWKCTRQAINSSVVTPFATITVNNNLERIGILNHLIKMKLNTGATTAPQMTIAFMKGKTKDQILKEIYENRSFYVRIEVTDPEGIAPGSNAVLQIWPPFACSPIHNHGEAYGLIKVLSNKIRVQNFSDLNFTTKDSVPYSELEYQQNQFTWLSQFSFGIHRLVNTTPTTTLSLQSYAGDLGSKQFFECVVNNESKQIYEEYYPQHDWLNYLNLANDPNTPSDDKKFIQGVIDANHLSSDNKIDSSFSSFVMALKREYTILASLMDS